MKTHLIVYEIIQNYTLWYYHGERLGEPQSNSELVDNIDIEQDNGEDEIYDILRDLYPTFNVDNTETGGNDDPSEEEPNAE